MSLDFIERIHFIAFKSDSKFLKAVCQSLMKITIL